MPEQRSDLDVFFEAMDEVFPGETKPAFVAPPVVPVEQRDDAYARRASGWCAKALQGRAETLAGMLPDTGRNHQLNASAYLLLRYVQAGHLDVDEVVEAMRHAALECGLGNGEIEATLGSAQRAAWRDGAAEPPLSERDADPFAGLVVDEATGEVAAPQMSREELEQRAHERAVRLELANLRARDEAKTLYTAEKASRTFREPPSVATLAEQLRLPREPVRFSVEQILPRGGNVLLTAAFKAGKTTLVSNLLRSYADDLPFLGRFGIHPHAGRIGIFNYELSQQQYDQWLEDSGIEHPERVAVLHLRGYRLDLRAPSVEDWVVRWLAEHEVSTWIADPFARAAVGVDENSNTEVGQWLDTFDVIKERAGVIDGVLPVHTGRAEQEQGQERARGATRLDDWADARWILTRDEQGNRFFRATGRDVDVEEERLSFDEATRALTIGGGDRKWVAKRAVEDLVVQYVTEHPGSLSTEIASGVGGNKTLVPPALRAAVATHRLREVDGKGTRKHYFPPGMGTASGMGSAPFEE